MRNKKFTLNAMMEDDMFSMMKRNGDFQKMLDGTLLCPCGKQITEQNLDAMKKIGGKIVYYHSIICTS